MGYDAPFGKERLKWRFSCAKAPFEQNQKAKEKYIMKKLFLFLNFALLNI